MCLVKLDAAVCRVIYLPYSGHPGPQEPKTRGQSCSLKATDSPKLATRLHQVLSVCLFVYWQASTATCCVSSTVLSPSAHVLSAVTWKLMARQTKADLEDKRPRCLEADARFGSRYVRRHREGPGNGDTR